MLHERISAAAKQSRSDIVFRNISVVDVFTQDIFVTDVAVADGVFVGIGQYAGYGRQEVDGTGLFMAPGLIDAHVHIESSLVTPVEYGRVVLPRGVTGVVADPHEIANVCGVEGIRFMLENARLAQVDVYMMLPSCVPATAFEHAGSILRAKDLAPLYDDPGVFGLAEVMDFPAVLNGDSDMLQKLEDAVAYGYPIDGHGAGFSRDQLNAYSVANIRTDHECDTSSGLYERVRRGMYTLVREGTVCKDLLKLLPAVNSRTARMLCFATDDKHLDDIRGTGGVDANVRLAIAHGLAPATAIQIASLNAAACYRLVNTGAIAPGYVADFSILTDLERFTVRDVYKNGVLTASGGELMSDSGRYEHYAGPEMLTETVKLPELTAEDLAIDMQGCQRANIIGVEPGTVVSEHLIEQVRVEEGCFVVNVHRDQVKIVVVERHHNLGTIGKGIVKGLRLERGAIATTVAHDSHNLIAAGTNDQDLLCAIAEIDRLQGGIAVVADGKVLASLRLEIAGLMTSRSAADVLEELAGLNNAVAVVAPSLNFNPFLTLSFMSLVVIPHLKLSDGGLFEFSSFQYVDLPVPG